jgi:hypothetical protein
MESEEQINREPEAPTGPGPTEQDSHQDLPPGYGERQEEGSAQAGDDGPTAPDAKSDREPGGPVAEADAPESTGGAAGTKPESGFEPHE